MQTVFMCLFLVLIAGPVAQGAKAEFGPSWNLVLALDIINTVVVVFYLWRIWREKLGTPVTKQNRS